MNKTFNLKDITILILGLGESGLAMARWCVRSGAAEVRVWDSREVPPHAENLQTLAPSAKRLVGPLSETTLDGVQLVLKSPGLAPGSGPWSALLQQAQRKALPILGELDLFASALADLREAHGYQPKVLAISGTNGKTTTTAMTSLLVDRSGMRAAMAGNVGPTMLGTLMDALDETDAAAIENAESENAASPLHASWPEVWVLELSSFQLDAVQGFEPDAAVVLNVTQDHLDWHRSMDAYVAAKARVFGKRAVMVINRDDPWVEKLAPEVPAAKGRAKPVAPLRQVIRFGLDAPRRAGDFGLLTEQGITWLVRAREPDETLKNRRKSASVEEEPDELSLQRLMPADALLVRGRHNAANALAALALASSIGCPLAPMLHALREYRGEPHRVALVAHIQGVDVFDDSKGTNVGATVAALKGLGPDKAPGKLIVILGGEGKGQDFTPLRDPLVNHARAVATLGRDAEAIEVVLATTDLPWKRHATLPAATAWCFEQAQAGDAVLLSPACASLDMFSNYAHRADVFVQAVHAHAAASGVML
jgi:UDP-N-acetylmuramoylalanine--D-glutamate ligase